MVFGLVSPIFFLNGLCSQNIGKTKEDLVLGRLDHICQNSNYLIMKNVILRF